MSNFNLQDFIKYRWPVKFSPQLLEIAENQFKNEDILMKCIRTDNLDDVLQEAFAENIVASYAIENEYLDSEAVKSLVIDSMGLNTPDWECDELKTSREARAVRGTLVLMSEKNLSHEDIFHAFSIIRGYEINSYRNHPEVVKNGLGKIIYKGPPEIYVNNLMDKFISWWNNERKELPPPLGAAVAHYIFISIHPFGDGNGRMSRALCDRAMIKARKDVFRPYSWSAAILENRLDYYGSLKASSPELFLRFMLKSHSLALKSGFAQAARFRFLEKIFLSYDLDNAEKEMIKEMSKYRQAKWDPEDFFRIENPEDVWKRLQRKGLIDAEGKLVDAENIPASQANNVKPQY